MQTITNATEHEAALLRITDLMEENPDAGTDDATELQELAVAVEVYEQANHNIGAPTEQEAAAFRAEQEVVHTHIIFYTRITGKAKDMTGTLAGLRAWAKEQFRLNEIVAGWEIDKL